MTKTITAYDSFSGDDSEENSNLDNKLELEFSQTKLTSEEKNLISEIENKSKYPSDMKSLSGKKFDFENGLTNKHFEYDRKHEIAKVNNSLKQLIKSFEHPENYFDSKDKYIAKTLKFFGEKGKYKEFVENKFSSPEYVLNYLDSAVEKFENAKETYGGIIGDLRGKIVKFDESTSTFRNKIMKNQSDAKILSERITTCSEDIEKNQKLYDKLENSEDFEKSMIIINEIESMKTDISDSQLKFQITNRSYHLNLMNYKHYKAMGLKSKAYLRALEEANSQLDLRIASAQLAIEHYESISKNGPVGIDQRIKGDIKIVENLVNNVLNLDILDENFIISSGKYDDNFIENIKIIEGPKEYSNMGERLESNKNILDGMKKDLKSNFGYSG